MTNPQTELPRDVSRRISDALYDSNIHGSMQPDLLKLVNKIVAQEVTTAADTAREDEREIVTKNNFSYFISMLIDIAQNPGKDALISIRGVIDLAMEAQKIRLKHYSDLSKIKSLHKNV